MERKLGEKIAIAFELSGGVQLSEPAKRVLFAELDQYPSEQIEKALGRCRREVKGRLTPADIIQRIEDGRPGAEEAWAMVPKTEDESAVWTTEMAVAFGVIRDFMDDQDEQIAARMSFKAAYTRICAEARAQRHPIKWEWSPGHDESLRQRVLLEAVEKNRLTAARALELAPHLMEEPLQARGLLPAVPEAKQLPRKKRYDPDTGVELVSPEGIAAFVTKLSKMIDLRETSDREKKRAKFEALNRR